MQLNLQIMDRLLDPEIHQMYRQSGSNAGRSSTVAANSAAGSTTLAEAAGPSGSQLQRSYSIASQQSSVGLEELLAGIDADSPHDASQISVDDAASIAGNMSVYLTEGFKKPGPV